MRDYLGILGFLVLLVGGAWGGQVILFLDRNGPFDYGRKGFAGALLWLSFMAWAGIRVMEWSTS